MKVDWGKYIRELKLSADSGQLTSRNLLKIAVTNLTENYDIEIYGDAIICREKQ